MARRTLSRYVLWLEWLEVCPVARMARIASDVSDPVRLVEVGREPSVGQLDAPESVESQVHAALGRPSAAFGPEVSVAGAPGQDLREDGP